MSKTDIWFAWYPVRIGALQDGPKLWLKRVWRNRTFFGGMWITIYAELTPEMEARLTKAQS